MSVVTVATNTGRTQTEKDRLAEAITDDIVRIWKVQKKEVIVVFQEPLQFLFSRLVIDPQTTASKLVSLDSLNTQLRKNDKLIDGKNPAIIDWRDIGARGPKKFERDLQDLTAFANTYRHLGITDIINDKGLDVSKKKKAIIERIKLLDKFYKNNPKLDLELIDFFDVNREAGQGASRREDGKLNWKGIPDAYRPLLRKQLMAYQRMQNIADSTEDREILLSKGYDSSTTIADKTQYGFERTSGLEVGKARMIHNKAQEYMMVVDNILRKCIHLACTVQGYRKGKG
jgi:4-oxalocrotonate tautomerase